MTRKCSLCGKKFASTQALNIHVTDEHEYKFLCKFRKCRSEYSSQTLADRHIRHHSPPRYQCEHCGKQFHEKYVLEAHTNVHTEKGYKCTYPKCHRIYYSYPVGLIMDSSDACHCDILPTSYPLLFAETAMEKSSTRNRRWGLSNSRSSPSLKGLLTSSLISCISSWSSANIRA